MKNTMAALLWKEWRQGRTTFLVMASLLALAVLALARLSAEDQGSLAAWGLVSKALLWVFGALIGGRAFAHEREEGTHAFLLRMPVSSGTLWRSKVLVGLLVVALLCLLDYTLDVFPIKEADVQSVAVLRPPVGALIVFAMALLVSSFLDNTLLAAGMGLACGGWGALFLFVVGRHLFGSLASMYGKTGQVRRPELFVFLISTLGVLAAGLLLAASREILALRCRRSKV